MFSLLPHSPLSFSPLPLLSLFTFRLLPILSPPPSTLTITIYLYPIHLPLSSPSAPLFPFRPQPILSPPPSTLTLSIYICLYPYPLSHQPRSFPSVPSLSSLLHLLPLLILSIPTLFSPDPRSSLPYPTYFLSPLLRTKGMRGTLSSLWEGGEAQGTLIFHSHPLGGEERGAR